MKFGFVGSYGTPQQIIEMAQAAEHAGWDGFFTWDGMSLGETPTYDPMSMLAAIAVATKTITIGAMIFALPRHRPWTFVRQSITVDHLSGGRLVIPVGLGAVPHDVAFTNIAGESPGRKERAERLDETLDFITEAWKGTTFSHHGTHYHTDNLVFRPVPVRQPRIPIWVVASYPAPKSVGRALRYDGIVPSIAAHPFEALTADEVRQVAASVREHHGGDGTFDIIAEGMVENTDEAIANLESLADAGATWWIESRWDTERDTPESLMARIQQGPPRRSASSGQRVAKHWTVGHDGMNLS